MLRVICDACNHCASVLLPNTISAGICEWAEEKSIFSMSGRERTDGLTLEGREDAMTDVSALEYKEARRRHIPEED